MSTAHDNTTEARYQKGPGAHLSDALLADLSALIHSHTGLHFPRQKWNDLERHMRAAARDFGCRDVQSCVQWLLQGSPSQEQLDVLVGRLTIGETFFFRDKVIFQLLEQRVFRELCRSGQDGARSLRIWSAGCCTGEEPYSVAMLLDQMVGQWQGWSVEIIGTDINPRFLELAKEGVYTRWSLRATSDPLIRQYFKELGKNRFEIAPRIKRMVRFLPFNLAADSALRDLPPGVAPCQLILCRNVLLYLSPEMIDRVVERLTRGLANGGWLIVSPSETAFVRSRNLATVHFSGAILHRKGPAARPCTEEAERLGSSGRRESDPAMRHATAQLDRGLSRSPSLRRPPTDCPMESTSPAPEGRGQRHPKRTTEQGTGPDNQFEKALTLYAEGRHEETARVMEELLTADSGRSDRSADPERMMLLARSLANLGRLAEARQWCEKAVAEARLNAECHYLLATIYQESGMMRESLEALKKTVYLDPRLVMAYVSMANVARLQGKPEEADRYFLGAVSLLDGMDPKELVPHSDGMTAQSLKLALTRMVE